MCVYMGTSVYSKADPHYEFIIHDFDIVTVTAIMGYKILPGALPPKKQRVAVSLALRAFCT